MKIKFEWKKYTSYEEVERATCGLCVAIVRQRYEGENWEYSMEKFEITPEGEWVWEMDFNEGQEMQILYWADWYGTEIIVNDFSSDEIEEVIQ